MIHRCITRGNHTNDKASFNHHYKDLPTMHTCNIDTLEILSPYNETNIFMNSNLLSCVERVTYFWSSVDLHPNLSQTVY